MNPWWWLWVSNWFLFYLNIFSHSKSCVSWLKNAIRSEVWWSKKKCQHDACWENWMCRWSFRTFRTKQNRRESSKSLIGERKIQPLKLLSFFFVWLVDKRKMRRMRRLDLHVREEEYVGGVLYSRKEQCVLYQRNGTGNKKNVLLETWTCVKLATCKCSNEWMFTKSRKEGVREKEL